MDVIQQYSFTDSEMQVIVQALGEMPLKTVFGVFASINKQRAENLSQRTDTKVTQ